MIDIHSEDLLSLKAAIQTLPTRPCIATIHRWRAIGVRGIKLETVMVGGIRYTSRQALDRFFARTNAVADGEEPSTVRTVRERKRAISHAERELDQAGI